MNYIGIDLGGTNIKGALVSAEGEILKEHSIPTRVDLGPEAVAGRIGQVIAQLSIGEDTVGGVGVGCPGTVDDASGIVRFAANLNFVNFDLRSALRAHTALPIHLGNDANAAALGEALFGCGRGAESTIVVTLGTGVGGEGGVHVRPFVIFALGRRREQLLEHACEKFDFRGIARDRDGVAA